MGNWDDLPRLKIFIQHTSQVIEIYITIISTLSFKGVTCRLTDQASLGFLVFTLFEYGNGIIEVIASNPGQLRLFRLSLCNSWNWLTYGFDHLKG